MNRKDLRRHGPAENCFLRLGRTISCRVLVSRAIRRLIFPNSLNGTWMEHGPSLMESGTVSVARAPYDFVQLQNMSNMSVNLFKFGFYQNVLLHVTLSSNRCLPLWHLHFRETAMCVNCPHGAYPFYILLLLSIQNIPDFVKGTNARKPYSCWQKLMALMNI